MKQKTEKELADCKIPRKTIKNWKIGYRKLAELHYGNKTDTYSKKKYSDMIRRINTLKCNEIGEAVL
jgi:hypothetical protein